MGHLAQVGLALATSVGAWINLSLLALFARRQGFAVSGAAIGKPVAKLLASPARSSPPHWSPALWARTRPCRA